MSEKIITITGPKGLSGGVNIVAGWKDKEGFHRIYARGYDSHELAKAAAKEEARKFGRRFWHSMDYHPA